MSFSRLTVDASSAALRALAACVRTLLGPQHTLKLAHASETEPALLTSDALAVLSALDVEASAAGALLLEACEGQHAAHGCGVTTLVCLVGEVAAAAQALVAEGFRLDDALLELHAAAELCCGVASEVSLVVARTVPPPSPLPSPPGSDDDDGDGVSWFFESDGAALAPQPPPPVLPPPAKAAATTRPARREEAERLKQRGNAQLARGELESALADYAAALAELEGDGAAAHAETAAVCWSNAALAHIRLDHPAEALDCAQRAVRLSACYAKAHHRLATALRMLGRVREADVAFAVAARLSGGTAPARRHSPPPPKPPPPPPPPPLSAWLPALADGLAHGQRAQMRLAARTVELLLGDGGGDGEPDASRVTVTRLVGAPPGCAGAAAAVLVPLPPHERAHVEGAWSQLAEAPGARPPSPPPLALATDGAAATAGIALLMGDLLPDSAAAGEWGAAALAGGREELRGVAALKAYERADDAAAAVAAALEAAGTRVVLALSAVDARVQAGCLARGILVVAGVGRAAIDAAAALLGIAPFHDLRGLLAAPRAPATARCWLLRAGRTPAEDAVVYSAADAHPVGAFGAAQDAYLCVCRAADGGGGGAAAVSVLACAHTEALAREAERRFWGCFSRLRSAMRSGRVLPGAGAFEAACIAALERRAEAAAAAAADGAAAVEPAMDAVLRAEASAAFARAMRGMLRAPLDNAGVAADDAEGRITRAVGCWRAGGVVAAATGEPSASPLLGAVGDGDDGGTVYDALEPKLAAIRASVQTVELLLRADAMITNQQVNAPDRPPMLS